LNGKEFIEISRDDNNIHSFLSEGLFLAQTFHFPGGICSTESKIKIFKDNYSYYRNMPNDFLRGFFLTGNRITDKLKGINLHKNYIHFRALGDIFIKPPDLIRNITRIQVEENGFTFFGIKKTKPKSKFKVEKHQETNLTELKKTDDILYHLMVNQAYTEYGPKRFWKLYDTIKYFNENPELTRRDLEKMGVKSDKVWELIADYQPALSKWIKSGSKPKDTPNYFQSKNQYIQRLKEEVRMPDVVNDNDVEKGHLKGQSYESQIYRASSSAKFHFFT
jgi:hypothetical protein